MILYAEVECFFYDGNSLKDKRSILKRLFAKLTNDHNVAVAELDYQDLWQRTKFGIVTISSNSNHAEKVIQQVLRIVDQFPELERTITTVDKL
ncbi:DUF503 family protein [Oceanobacillus luteolus]|uniref:DUF503 domain-containing protein n=1 Tax=Oceanobacillus luteolus TaxID=1274358 RepID=A0ABW4HQX5_9BACI|nr:DUF503 family protein [Oceanobacillus luteolus]MCM3739006.1 DUF503 family protein [Oceanobacillus luteolus]